MTRKTEIPAPHDSVHAADRVVTAMLKGGKAQAGDDSVALAWCDAGLVKGSEQYAALLGKPTWRERIVQAKHSIATSPWRLALPALPVAAAAGFVLYVMTPHPAHYEAHGQSQRITLADQSSILLAPSSTIDFHIADGKRMAKLVGKAEFSIAHDKVHPFLVATGTAQVRVVGTHFTLTYRNGCTQLSVVSGSVVMQSPSMMPRRLAAGEEAVNIDDGKVHNSCFVASEGSALRSSYIDAPLSTVVQDIGRFYPKKIRIVSPELGRKRVTMSFGIDEVQNIIDVIPETLDAHLVTSPTEVKIVANFAP